jgi:ArsR family transcriptional regulator
MKGSTVMDAYQQSAELLKAMAHPERLRLLAALRDGAQCVCHLTALLEQRQPYVSQQLAYLRDAGLVADYREGLNVYYRIREPRVFALLDTASEIIGHSNAFREVRISPRLLAECPCPRCAAA